MGIDLILGWLTGEEAVVWMYHYLVISMPMSGIVKRQFQSLEGLLGPVGNAEQFQFIVITDADTLPLGVREEEVLWGALPGTRYHLGGVVCPLPSCFQTCTAPDHGWCHSSCPLAKNGWCL